MQIIFKRKTLINTLPYKNILNLSNPRIFCSSRSMIQANTPIQTNRDIVIKTMTEENLSVALTWAKKENWNPGIQEHRTFYAADPFGYRMLWLDGRPIASLATVKYSEAYAFLGLYIVIPEFRGQGYGKLLWDVSMKTVNTSSCLALNSVLEQVNTYKKSGFYSSNLNTRWVTNFFHSNINKKVVPSSLTHQVHLDEIVDFDYKNCATYRVEFWKKSLSNPGSFFLAFKENDKIKGVGSISKSVDGYKLGPVYADNQSIAENIVTKLWQHAQTLGDSSNNVKATIQLDTTGSNPYAALLAKKLGFKEVFETVRMYKGHKPPMNESKVYGLTSLEIG